MAVERPRAVDGVDRGDDDLRPVTVLQRGLREQSGENRRRLGEARRLDHHAAEARDLALLTPCQ